VRVVKKVVAEGGVKGADRREALGQEGRERGRTKKEYLILFYKSG